PVPERTAPSFLSMLPPYPSSQLFPYTTLFRSQAVIQVCSAVGNLVGEIDKLGFQGRALVQEVFGQLGECLFVIVAGVLDDASLIDRKSTRLNSSHLVISYAVFCLKKKKLYKHS